MLSKETIINKSYFKRWSPVVPPLNERQKEEYRCAPSVWWEYRPWTYYRYQKVVYALRTSTEISQQPMDLHWNILHFVTWILVVEVLRKGTMSHIYFISIASRTTLSWKQTLNRWCPWWKGQDEIPGNLFLYKVCKLADLECSARYSTALSDHITDPLHKPPNNLRGRGR